VVTVAWPTAAAADTGLAMTVTASGSAGAIDSSFGNNGFATVSLGTWVAAAGDVIQPDGKIVAAGEGEINGVNAIVVTRMAPSGQLDQSFGDNGVVTVAPPGGAGMDSGAAIALQSDGKIIVAGTARYQGTGPLAMAAVRLRPDGTPDPAFGNDGIALVPIGSEAIANAVAVEPGGKIVLGGGALVASKEFAAARLNPDGSLDTSFGMNGVATAGPTGAAWGMVLEPDGKLLLGGGQDAGGSTNFMAMQLLPSGAIDRAFAHDGVLEQLIGTRSMATAVALQPDGKILLAGSAVTPRGSVGAALRLLPDGSLDSSFGTLGVATFPDYSVNAVALDSSGRIVVAGVGATVSRLASSGSVDRSFGNNGIARAALGSNDAANGLAIDPASGDLVLAGVATVAGREELCVARLTVTDSGSRPATKRTEATAGTHGYAIPSAPLARRTRHGHAHSRQRRHHKHRRHRHARAGHRQRHRRHGR
jgi:uncharacterized delta-60 repeat protein